MITPAKDEKDIKEAIVKLITDKKLRKRLERNARKKALKYSWKKVAKQYLNVFKQVIKENKQNLTLFPLPIPIRAFALRADVGLCTFSSFSQPYFPFLYLFL